MVKSEWMDYLKFRKMNAQVDLRNYLKKGVLSNELDLERALILDRKLRLLVKEHPELADERRQLRIIIKAYEKNHWSAGSDISDTKLKESDNAEFFAEQERKFNEARKKYIKEKINSLNLSQQDLGKILGHGKSYMSELLNGISPFSIRDLIILHRLFHIKLELLLPTFISQKDKEKINDSLIKLNKADLLKLEKEDLVCT